VLGGGAGGGAGQQCVAEQRGPDTGKGVSTAEAGADRAAQ
jgi:hypothetical protein